jgi:peroxiredoxin
MNHSPIRAPINPRTFSTHLNVLAVSSDSIKRRETVPKSNFTLDVISDVKGGIFNAVVILTIGRTQRG